MCIVILGGNGVLGSYLSKYLKENKYTIFEVNRSNESTIFKEIIKHNIKTIVNCVALTNVDKCEKNIELAFNSNAYYIKNIASKIEIKGVNFIQISTDQVYSGIGPHSEHKVSPINIYGLTKLLGEEYSKVFNSGIGNASISARKPIDWTEEPTGKFLLPWSVPTTPVFAKFRLTWIPHDSSFSAIIFDK